MTQPARDRVTVDLRGLGERLRSQAAARRLTAGAFVRRAVLSQLEGVAPAPGAAAEGPLGPVFKVTLRLSSAHAVLLATRARQADVSLGRYLAGLLDGMPPPPLPPDHAQAVAALVGSTDQLAVLSTDLNCLLRALSHASLDRLEPYRKSVLSLHGEARKHLAMAAALMKQLRPARNPPADRPRTRR